MSILLTGAGGNFGTAFLRQSADQTIPLDRHDWDHLESRIAMGPDVVVHAASDLQTRVSVSPTDVINSNIMITTKLLEAIKGSSVNRFIFLSSCAVYGQNVNTNEDANNCAPVSVNGISKLLNEKIIAEFCQANDIKFQILRVFNMYGGQDRFSIISRLLYAKNEKKPFILYNQGIAQRDFIHVNDVVDITLKLLKISPDYSHINIGSGVATKVSTLVDTFFEYFPDLLIHDEVSHEAEYSRADISRLQQLMPVNCIRIEDFIRNEICVNL